MKIKITQAGVTDHNSLLDVGTVIELDDRNAVSLIESGHAEALESKTPKLTVDEMAKTLDTAYKSDELKAAATKAGVVFDIKVTKADLIAIIIAAGKYADLV